MGLYKIYHRIHKKNIQETQKKHPKSRCGDRMYMIRLCGQSWTGGGYGKKWPLKNNMQISIRDCWFRELWALCWGPICFFTLGQKFFFFYPGKTDRFLKISPKPNQECRWFSSSFTVASRTLMANFPLLPPAFLVPVDTPPGIKAENLRLQSDDEAIEKRKMAFCQQSYQPGCTLRNGKCSLEKPTI